MKTRQTTLQIGSILAFALTGLAQAQTTEKPDLSKQPTLYVVGYAHLDTEWRWEYPQVIDEYLRRTMQDNFNLFEKYPHYVFNFSGANRYRLMKEYFPADFARLKKYVDEGRWFPAGSSMEEGDVNTPSAEGIIRQVLYGNNWFRARVRQSQRRIYAAGLLRLSRLVADHPGTFWRKGFFHTKARLGIFGRWRWIAIARKDAGRYPLQRRCVGRPRRRVRAGRRQSR